MKKLFFVTTCLMYIIVCRAQFKINSTGNIGINRKAPHDNITLAIGENTKSIDSCLVTLYCNSNMQPCNNQQKIYAGYFDGNTKFQGDLHVAGAINGLVLGNCFNNKQSNNLVLRDALDDIVNMNIYVQKQDYTFSQNIDKSLVPSIKEQFDNKIHYVLSSDELENSFPNLIYETNNEGKKINYIELIPLLIQSIKELQSEINDLRDKTFNTSFGNDNNSTVTDNKHLFVQLPTDYVSSTTRIALHIPNEITDARLYIYDIHGQKHIEYHITERGDTFLTISEASLKNGIYFYNLTFDGKIAEAKRFYISNSHSY